ncbi:hypothetical protein ACFL6U_13915 [Planctomycetota bacterium]
MFRNGCTRSIGYWAAITLKFKLEDALALDSRNSTICKVLDNDGNDIELRSPVFPIESLHCWTLIDPQSKAFELQLHLGPNEPVPLSLSQLNFFVYAVEGQPLTTFDIPFEAGSEWQELLPGFRILVETADYKDGECHYSIKEKISSSHLSYSQPSS